MRSGALVAFVVLGAAAVYVLWDVSRRRTISAPASSSQVNGYMPTSVDRTTSVGRDDSLQLSINALSRAISDQSIRAGVAAGSAAGGAAGGGVGGGVSSAEQGLARGLGVTALTDAQIASLESNSSSNGLAAGATAGANAGGVAGGAVGAAPFDFLSGFFRAAAFSDFLRPGGTADQLGLPKLGTTPAKNPTATVYARSGAW